MLFSFLKFKNIYKQFFLLLLPFLIWLIIFKDFIIGGDSLQYFYWVKYYLTGIRIGEYPMWDPFHSWGAQDNFDMRFIGEFNPLLYLTLFLNILGVPLLTAFSIYLIVYFYTGLLGFYLLAQQFFQDKRWAYLSYVLLMFSVLGQTMLEQLSILLIAVPAVWFFFLIGFIQTGKIRYFVGFTFSCMILATTYMPFHFLSILLPIVILFVLFYFRQIKNIFTLCLTAFNKHRWISVLCLLSLCLSIIPGLNWYTSAQSSEYVLNVNRTSDNPEQAVLVDVHSINIGSSATEITFDELFDDLDLGFMYFFYISVFIYLIIALSIINPWNKRLSILFFASLFVLFQSFADVTALHQFLYNHFFLYKLYRNYFFFLTLLIPMFILFSVEQLRLFLDQKSNHNKKTIFIVTYSTFIHLCFLNFLRQMDHVILTSYISVLISMIFFAFYFLNTIKSNRTIIIILVIIASLQPIETCYHALKYRRGNKNTSLNKTWTPSFSFIRPSRDEETKTNWGYRENHKMMIDDSGFRTNTYFGTGFSYLFHEEMNPTKIQNYIQHKFVIYDNVEYMPENDIDIKRVEKALSNQKNLGFIHNSDQSVTTDHSPAKSSYIKEESNKFQIINFSLNGIKFKTNFPTKKFLVYNDSYHTLWHATINGKKTDILRSNIAFKGIWLNPGENIIHFQFGKSWFHLLNLFLIGYFFFFIIYLIHLFVKEYENN